VSPTLSRTLTVIAAAVLAFDGAALALLGWWSRRAGLGIIGLGLFISSGLVLLYWQRYRRRLEDIVAARRALSEEAREMQRLLRDR
jgi:threonine aldolase